MDSNRMTHLCQANNSSQITDWWQEAEQSMRAGHLARARRFLRWIVACCPQEEEGWLVLAHLMADSEEQVPLLRDAYRFHPHSQRVQIALREARRRELERAVGELKPRGPIPRCLPDERKLPRRAGATRGNNHVLQPDQAAVDDAHRLRAEDTFLPWPLAPLARFLLHAPSPAASNGQSNGQGQTVASRWEGWPS